MNAFLSLPYGNGVGSQAAAARWLSHYDFKLAGLGIFTG
jgi:hypothetical protein